MGPISGQLHISGAGTIKHVNGLAELARPRLAASPCLRHPPHCLTPFSELPAARGCACHATCRSRPPRGPLRSPTYLRLALRVLCKVAPLPAPAVSPITPLYPLLPNTLGVLATLALSLSCTFVDTVPPPEGPPSPSPPGKRPSAFQESCSVMSDCFRPHGLEPTRLFCRWNSPG